jgi:hypothetical protein
MSEYILELMYCEILIQEKLVIDMDNQIYISFDIDKNNCFQYEKNSIIFKQN